MKQRQISLKSAQRKHFIKMCREFNKMKRMEICKLLGISSSMLSKIDNRVYKDFGFTQEEIENYKVEDMWKGESGVGNNTEFMPTVQ